MGRKNHPPTSTVGVLRLHGLLFVGKAGPGGRNYKVAVMPKEIMGQFVRILK